ncbi:MAG: hypothetical protein WA960_09095 [Tunicatimonas sp.]
MNDNQDHLRRALRQLPTHQPRPDAWEALERSLEEETPLRRALAQLPEHKPKAARWAPIARMLAARERPTMRLWLRYAAAVGTIVLLSVAIFFLTDNQATSGSTTITYSEEVTPSPESFAPPDSLEQEAWNYVQQLCQQAPATTCQQPEFVALRAHLQELTEEERALQKTMQELGYDPQLVKYQIRIENMKAEATRELIQLVIS